MTLYEETTSPTVVADTAAEYDLDVNHEYVHLDDLDELSEEAIEGIIGNSLV